MKVYTLWEKRPEMHACIDTNRLILIIIAITITIGNVKSLPALRHPAISKASTKISFSTLHMLTSRSSNSDTDDAVLSDADTNNESSSNTTTHILRSMKRPNVSLRFKSVGVDFGTVRTGVAVSSGYNPRPLAIFSDLENEELCREITRIADVEKARQIVVGMPYEMNGTETEQAEIVRDFTSILCRTSLAELGPNVTIWFWDERCSSKEAEARLRSENPLSNTRGILDADAACIILEHFYLDKGEGAELATVEIEEYRIEAEAKWKVKAESIEEARRRMIDQRGINLNARKAAMAKVAAMEAENGRVPQGGKKKKKKKKKR